MNHTIHALVSHFTDFAVLGKVQVGEVTSVTTPVITVPVEPETSLEPSPEPAHETSIPSEEETGPVVSLPPTEQTEVSPAAVVESPGGLKWWSILLIVLASAVVLLLIGRYVLIGWRIWTSRH